MTKDIAIADEVPFLGADWFDPLEAGIRQHIRGFIENLLEEELAATLRRGRYDRSMRRLGIATATGTANCSAHSDR